MASQQPALPIDPAAATLPGAWKLAPGRAVTLLPGETGVLRVAHGEVWATWDGPHEGPPNDLGDRFLSVGDQLTVPAGRRLVLEPRHSRASAYFAWEPVTALAGETVRRPSPLVQPIADLRLAMTLAGAAAARLLSGLAGLARALAAPTLRRGSAA